MSKTISLLVASIEDLHSVCFAGAVGIQVFADDILQLLKFLQV